MAGLLTELAWKTVPTLLLVFLCTGYPYAVFHLLPYVWQHQSRTVAVAWALEFHASLTALLYCFYLVAFRNLNDARPPRNIPSRELTLSSQQTPKACNKDGTLDVYCTSCRRYQPLRTRHCKRHDECSVGFDHCCPWFDACINLYTLKPFVAFVALAPMLLLPPAALLLPIIRMHYAEVWPFWNSDALHSLWWTRKRSWAVGPVYRYIGGLVHCVWHWQEQPNMYKNVASPHLSASIYFVLCLVVSLVGLAMLGISLRQISKNQLTPELERSKRWKEYVAALQSVVPPDRKWDQHRYIWVPAALDASGTDTVRHLDPSVVNLYDAGVKKNLAMCLGNSILDFLQLSKPPPAAPGFDWVINREALALLPTVDDKDK